LWTFAETAATGTCLPGAQPSVAHETEKHPLLDAKAGTVALTHDACGQMVVRTTFGPGSIKTREKSSNKKSTSQNRGYAIFARSGGGALHMKISSFGVFTHLDLMLPFEQIPAVSVTKMS